MWMNLEDIMIDEISQPQKDKYYVTPLIWDTWNNQIHADKKWNGVCQELGGEGEIGSFV